MHLRPDHRAGVYPTFYFKIGIRSNAASRANRCYAESKVESRKTYPHVRVDRRIAAHRKEHVIVHADQPGKYRVAGKIEGFDIRRNGPCCTRTKRLDLAIADQNGLVFPC